MDIKTKERTLNRMDNDDSEDTPEIEINIENINAKSEIVLNDLRLLELIYMHPYLISKAVKPHNDNDYEEWGWGQITKAFNSSYDGLNLTTPFSIEELRWRWDILRPMCHSFKDSQLPTQFRNIMSNIKQLMNGEPQPEFQEDSQTQSLILDQIPFIEQLPFTLQKQLEVEVQNAIFTEEKSVNISLSEEETKVAQSEYEQFFKTIRVKELTEDDISRKRSTSKATASIANKHESDLVVSQNPVSLQPEPVTKKLEAQHQQPQPKNPQPEPQHPNPEPEPPNPEVEHPEPKPIKLFTQPLIIKEEPPDLFEVEQQELKEQLRDTPAQPRYVPLYSAMHYVKNVQVRVKRLDLEDYMRLTNVRQLRKCRVKMYK